MDKETLSIVISITSVVVAACIGGAAFWRAGKSNETAADSVQVAKDSRRLASESNSLAETANTVAAASAMSAADAVTEAKRSADIAERVESRQVERDHVVWDTLKSKKLGYWIASNEGLDTAFQAYASVKLNNDWYHSDPKDIKPGDLIEFSFEEQYAKASQDAENLRKSMSNAGIMFTSSPKFKMSHIINWRTATGAWKTLES